MFRGKLCVSMMVLLIAAGSGRAEFQVNSYTTHHQTHPAVAVNGAGEFVVAWRSNNLDGRGGGVYARCFSATGAPVGEEFKVNVAQADVDNWTPAVAIRSDGGFVVAWVAVREGDCDVMARMFDRQGQAATEEFQVNESPSSTGQSMPSMAMDPTGRFVITWTHWSGGCYTGRSRIMGRIYQPDGTPDTGEFLIGDHANADRSDVGIDEAGRFVVGWIRMGDTYNRPYGEYILFRRYEADGTPAGDAVQIAGDVNSRWYGPSVAVGASGEFAITWAMGPFPCDIVAQHFDADGTPATEPYVVNTFLAGNQGHPRIAGDGQGEYLIVWDSQDEDGSCLGVYGQRCKQDGELIGAEFQINTFVQGRQWYADIARAGDKCVVVWISEGEDGSGYGVFGEMVTQ